MIKNNRKHNTVKDKNRKKNTAMSYTGKERKKSQGQRRKELTQSKRSILWGEEKHRTE